MPPEIALLESRALRDSVIERTDVLDKVKVLIMLPDGLHITTRMVAEYFEVGEEAVKSLAKRHREEFQSNGMHILRGSELQVFERSNLDLSNSSYPQGRAHLTLYPRRAVLNVAMLLRDSDIARRVRTYLLDIEESARSGPEARAEAGAERLPLEQILTERMLAGPIGTRLEAVEACLADVGSTLRELAPWMARVSARLDGMDRRLDAHGRVICAMSERLCDLGEDMTEVRRDVATLKAEAAQRRARRAKRRRG
ncbi:DUF1664 domain-containing protein [Streptomyces rugosispiralis]|uniref:DUF1664 domain-containing protein n=1 Tax=Streptomyces rugosispiralis TaxID=2967341 RepID=A0ABT1UZP1_9ACTN|nr:DUF1664 domain-containing protein [Streptomyces rugosispiralis]MCQ8190592.1 DUF1664 domain-containing protein [Streptomyces rugosispiralis]